MGIPSKDEIVNQRFAKFSQEPQLWYFLILSVRETNNFFAENNVRDLFVRDHAISLIY